jgi:hypothetical protein
VPRCEGVHASLTTKAGWLRDHGWEAGGTGDQAGGGWVIGRLHDLLLKLLLDALVLTILENLVALGLGDEAGADGEAEFDEVDQAGGLDEFSFLVRSVGRLFLHDDDTQSEKSLGLVAECDIRFRVGDATAFGDVPRCAGLRLIGV